MTPKIDKMTPQQIRERGRELLRLAKQKEEEVRNRQLIRIGEIFQREILNSWATPWPSLQTELENLLGRQVAPPVWGTKGGVKALLGGGENESN
jgi:hypothetical protein